MAANKVFFCENSNLIRILLYEFEFKCIHSQDLQNPDYLLVTILGWGYTKSTIPALHYLLLLGNQLYHYMLDSDTDFPTHSSSVAEEAAVMEEYYGGRYLLEDGG